MTVIAAIPADNLGNKLYIKDLRTDKDRFFVKYRSTYNDVKFMETELFLADEGRTFTICGDDGTVLWRFATSWLSKITE